MTEPMLPIEPNDPTLAIDSAESQDSIDSTEFVDQSYHFERGMAQSSGRRTARSRRLTW